MCPQSILVDFDSRLDYLYNLKRLGIKVGLEHTIELLKRCGDPQLHFKSIHIAGTNGKGSTCAIVSSILMEAGLKVGLYTSPHLIRFNERIRINGTQIDDDHIVEFIDSYQSDIDEIKSTFFETTSAMAFKYFSDKKVDVAVVETGLGGRLDSTNILSPDLTVITPISLDHREILGEDILMIGKEKGGIIKKGVPLVLAPQKEKVRSLLLKLAGDSGSVVNEVDPPTQVVLTESGTEFVAKDLSFKSPMIGWHQAINNSVAIEAARLFMPGLKKETVDSGLQKVKWPGRLQQLCPEIPLYYDVAHNVHGLHAILETIRRIFKQKPIGLFVMKGDKEIDMVGAAIKNQFEQLFISGAPEWGLLSGSQLSKKLSDVGLKGFEVMEPFEKALDRITKIAKTTNHPTLIFGSHYVAKAIFNKFGFLF